MNPKLTKIRVSIDDYYKVRIWILNMKWADRNIFGVSAKKRTVTIGFRHPEDISVMVLRFGVVVEYV